MNIFRVQANTNGGALRLMIRGLDQPFEALEIHDDIVVKTLEGNAGDRTGEMTFFRRHKVDVLRADHHIHRFIGFEAGIQTFKGTAKELDLIVCQHNAVKNVTLADEIRHEGILRLIINIFRLADLLDATLIHDHDGIGHGKCLFLIVGNRDKGDAGGLLDALQFVLHILTQTQIQCAQRLVQQQNLRLIDQRTGNGHTLLLTTGQRIDPAVTVALQADDFQHTVDALGDFFLGHFGHAQTEGNIVKHIQMREKRITLEHRIDLPLIGRHIVDPLAVKRNFTGGRRQEAANDPQGGGFTAAGRSQQC